MTKNKHTCQHFYMTKNEFTCQNYLHDKSVIYITKMNLFVKIVYMTNI